MNLLTGKICYSPTLVNPSLSHQNAASLGLTSSIMSDRTISPSDAGLLFHRWITEAIPVLAWFVSADKSISAKIRGYVSGFTRDVGLAISTESPAAGPPAKLPAYLLFADSLIAASEFEYQDETEVPEDFDLGSGLRVKMPNGNTLIIAERRLNKE